MKKLATQSEWDTILSCMFDLCAFDLVTEFSVNLFLHKLNQTRKTKVLAALLRGHMLPWHLKHVAGAVMCVLYHHCLRLGQCVGDAVLLLVADRLQKQSNVRAGNGMAPPGRDQWGSCEQHLMCQSSPWPPVECRMHGWCRASRHWPCFCDTVRSDSSASPCRHWAEHHYT